MTDDDRQDSRPEPGYPGLPGFSGFPGRAGGSGEPGTSGVGSPGGAEGGVTGTTGGAGVGVSGEDEVGALLGGLLDGLPESGRGIGDAGGGVAGVGAVGEAAPANPFRTSTPDTGAQSGPGADHGAGFPAPDAVATDETAPDTPDPDVPVPGMPPTDAPPPTGPPVSTDADPDTDPDPDPLGLASATGPLAPSQETWSPLALDGVDGAGTDGTHGAHGAYGVHAGGRGDGEAASERGVGSPGAGSAAASGVRGTPAAPESSDPHDAFGAAPRSARGAHARPDAPGAGGSADRKTGEAAVGTAGTGVHRQVWKSAAGTGTGVEHAGVDHEGGTGSGGHAEVADAAGRAGSADDVGTAGHADHDDHAGHRVRAAQEAPAAHGHDPSHTAHSPHVAHATNWEHGTHEADRTDGTHGSHGARGAGGSDGPHVERSEDADHPNDTGHPAQTAMHAAPSTPRGLDHAPAPASVPSAGQVPGRRGTGGTAEPPDAHEAPGVQGMHGEPVNDGSAAPSGMRDAFAGHGHPRDLAAPMSPVPSADAADAADAADTVGAAVAAGTADRVAAGGRGTEHAEPEPAGKDLPQGSDQGPDLPGQHADLDGPDRTGTHAVPIAVGGHATGLDLNVEPYGVARRAQHAEHVERAEPAERALRRAPGPVGPAGPAGHATHDTHDTHGAPATPGARDAHEADEAHDPQVAHAASAARAAGDTHVAPEAHSVHDAPAAHAAHDEQAAQAAQAAGDTRAAPEAHAAQTSDDTHGTQDVHAASAVQESNSSRDSQAEHDVQVAPAVDDTPSAHDEQGAHAASAALAAGDTHAAPEAHTARVMDDTHGTQDALGSSGAGTPGASGMSGMRGASRTRRHVVAEERTSTPRGSEAAAPGGTVPASATAHGAGEPQGHEVSAAPEPPGVPGASAPDESGMPEAPEPEAATEGHPRAHEPQPEAATEHEPGEAQHGRQDPHTASGEPRSAAAEGAAADSPTAPGPEADTAPAPRIDPRARTAAGQAYADAEREAVYRTIRERRDVRVGFRPDPVAHDLLTRILEAAHQAPSVGHTKPWDFLVVDDHTLRTRVHDLARAEREGHTRSLPGTRAHAFSGLKVEAILEAPLNIAVTVDPTRGPRPAAGRDARPMSAPYSAALAVENLWLAARAEGLGVGWVSFLDERDVARALDLPPHLDVVAYLCVGHVDEFPTEPELGLGGWAKGRPLSWAVHHDRYGRRGLPGREPTSLLEETIAAIGALSARAVEEAGDRQNRLSKPPGSLGVLEEVSVRLAGLSGECPPPIPEPAAVAVFAGDHGVHAQGVTPWPQEVTAQMVRTFLSGGAVVNAFAAQVGADVTVVDVGVVADLPSSPGLLPRKVARGTADPTQGPAMTRPQVLQALETGIEVARDLAAAGHRCLITGDMGIANTTPSAALVCAYTGTSPEHATGVGTGVDEETHRRKVDVVRRALEANPVDASDPVGTLAALGGLEHAALAGFVLGGAAMRVPVLLDGVIAGSAALAAAAISPESVSACFAGHRSSEPGHAVALDHLGLRPLVDLEMRLGEGSGALLALPILQASARVLRSVATLEDSGITAAP